MGARSSRRAGEQGLGAGLQGCTRACRDLQLGETREPCRWQRLRRSIPAGCRHCRHSLLLQRGMLHLQPPSVLPCLQTGTLFTPPVITPPVSPASASSPWANYTRQASITGGASMLHNCRWHGCCRRCRPAVAADAAAPQSPFPSQPQTLYIAIKTLNSTITGKQIMHFPSLDLRAAQKGRCNSSRSPARRRAAATDAVAPLVPRQR